MKAIRSAIALAGLAAGGAILPVIIVLGLLDPSERIAWSLIRAWSSLILFTGGVESLRSQGAGILTRCSGAVVMSNHESLLDPLVIMALSRRPIRFLARSEMFRIPLFGWALRATGNLAVRRGDPWDAIVVLKKAARAVREGNLIAVYPEGTRSTEDCLLPFKRGGFLLALQAHAPIVPVGISDTKLVCPKGWHWAGHSPIAVAVGDPIDTAPYTIDTVENLMNTVRDRILALRSKASAMNFAGQSDSCESL